MANEYHILPKRFDSSYTLPCCKSDTPNMDATYILDFEHCHYMDSSALAQLLVARNKYKEVVLINVTENVRDLLLLTKFDKLVTIK